MERAKKDKPILLIGIMSGTNWRHRYYWSSACREPAAQCVQYEAEHRALTLPNVKIVLPAEYLYTSPPLPRSPQPLECCTAAWKGRPPLANGSSQYFCRPHVKVTLASQYRFLPALAHARRILLGSLSLLWLAFVDDDSRISMARLLDQLRSPAVTRHISSDGLYLGDFGPAPARGFTISTLRHAPFACGGGGHVFDRAAARKLDFLACAQRWHGTCAQSDWMVGLCARRFGVRPLANGALSWLSCGFCAASCSRASKQRVLTTMARTIAAQGGDGLPGCAFAQQTPATLCEHDTTFRTAACSWPAHSVAVRHGWCNCSSSACTYKDHRHHLMMGGAMGGLATG